MTLDEHSDRTTAPDLSAALNQLWVRFLPEIRSRVDILEAAAAASTAGQLTGEQREAANSSAHKLAGTLGTFSLARGTELARVFEALSAQEDTCSSANAERLLAIAAEIRAIVDSRK